MIKYALSDTAEEAGFLFGGWKLCSSCGVRENKRVCAQEIYWQLSKVYF